MSNHNKLTNFITKKSNLYIYLGLFILLVAFISYFLSTGKQNIPVQTQPTIKTFSDPGNHFTISIPSNWISYADYGRQRTGIGTAHEETTRMEVANLSSGKVGLNFSVYEKAPTCDKTEKPNTTLAGMPAYYNPGHYSWTVYTTDSTIIIGYYYPGAGVYRGTRKITPVSQSQMDADQKTINRIISTLKLQTAQPLQCP